MIFTLTASGSLEAYLTYSTKAIETANEDMRIEVFRISIGASGPEKDRVIVTGRSAGFITKCFVAEIPAGMLEGGGWKWRSCWVGIVRG